tara:strand:+ start:1216 stop:1833 length:618 start_codon:yes stop_codon:yes gene_type:complete
MSLTTLEAVNQVLRRVGKQVVASLDTGGGSLAAYAERELDDASKAIQSEGWSWNTRNSIEKTADSSNEYVLSTFEAGSLPILSVSTPNSDEPNVAIEGPKLLNRTNNTTVFDENTTLTLDYVFQQPMVNIPGPFSTWIVSHAALKLSRQFYSNPDVEQLIAAEILDARRIALRDEIRVAEVNVLETTELRQVRGRPRMRDRSING